MAEGTLPMQNMRTSPIKILPCLRRTRLKPMPKVLQKYMQNKPCRSETGSTMYLSGYPRTGSTRELKRQRAVVGSFRNSVISRPPRYTSFGAPKSHRAIAEGTQTPEATAGVGGTPVPPSCTHVVPRSCSRQFHGTGACLPRGLMAPRHASHFTLRDAADEFHGKNVCVCQRRFLPALQPFHRCR